MKWIPALLVASRVVLAPVIAWLLIEHRAMFAGWLYIAAVLSDIYDGVIARKLGVVTLRLRLADGCADVWLFICLLAGLWVGYRALIMPLAWPFGIAMALQVLSWAFCFWRFRKMTSYHSFLAKLTGLSLLLGILALLFAGTTVPLSIALWIFVAGLLEEIAMTAVLRRYHHDVWNLAEAWRLRRSERDGDRERVPGP
ncbi:MAG: CDP-alcohol phosphatidyltransferase family protein [Chthoniobacter sp.]|uniref:CDP-alcohol phosphatidyltransferase family protein n=1 Tax=Chthoniobacter sp. TaxID=2510640 RepID=UPI0032ABF1A0